MYVWHVWWAMRGVDRAVYTYGVQTLWRVDVCRQNFTRNLHSTHHLPWAWYQIIGRRVFGKFLHESITSTINNLAYLWTICFENGLLFINPLLIYFILWYCLFYFVNTFDNFDHGTWNELWLHVSCYRCILHVCETSL